VSPSGLSSFLLEVAAATVTYEEGFFGGTISVRERLFRKDLGSVWRGETLSIYSRSLNDQFVMKFFHTNEEMLQIGSFKIQRKSTFQVRSTGVVPSEDHRA